MATKGKNIFAVFQDAKARGMVVAFVVVVFVITLVSYIIYERFAPPKVPTVVAVRGVPAVRSIPGIGDSSREYIKLQETKNVQETEAALQARTAAIPTITRTTYVSSDELLGDGGKSKVGCGAEDLQRARVAGVTAAELHCRGCSLAALKNAGYTAGDLAVAGVTAKELQAVAFTAKELKDAGFSAKDLAAAGYNIADLKNVGFSAAELKNAGFSVAELKTAGFGAAELKTAGFGAAELKNTDFNAEELKNAGFDAAELKDTGFSAAELKIAGFSANNLKAAGYEDEDLVRAGFDKSQIDAVNAANNSETGACSVANLAKFDVQKIKGDNLKKMGCSVVALKAAGFIPTELKNAGFTAKELKNAGFSAAELKAAGFSVAELKAAGFIAKDLKDAGYSAKDIKDVGYSANELQKAGFSAGELRQAGFSAKDFKDAGFAAKDLKNAGFSAGELRGAGYLANEIKAAGYTDGDMIRAGFDKAQLGGIPDEVVAGVANLACSLDNLTKLHAQKITGLALKKMGCSAAALKTAGYIAADLKAAGFNAAELKAAGFSARELKNADFTADELKNAGITVEGLKAAGYTDDELIRAGFDKKQLASLPGVIASESGACSVENVARLHAQKVQGSILKAMGCGAVALKAAGFSAQDLKDAGYSTVELQAAGIATDKVVSVDDLGVLKDGTGSEVSLVAAPSALDASSTWQQRLVDLRKQNEQQMSKQDYENQIRQEQQIMGGQASELFSSWVPVQVQQYIEGERDSGIAGAAGFAGQQGSGASSNVDVYKAGTILFAVLDTGINSDEQSPILATIVQGKLAGAKLLGNFQRVEKKVILQFGVLNVPHISTSMGINAVAIDPDTAHTVLATNVDSHYLLRFGSMFASSFISGLGQAIQTSGSATTTTIGTGGLSQQNTFPQLNTTQKALVALGNVGQQIGSMLGPIFNTPPTVEVKAGTSMGILIMSDLSVDKARE